MKAKFILIGLFISLTGFSQSTDSVLVKGLVISKDNYPLANATIRVSNTENTVNSDLTGQFEIWSPVEGILEFSCISEPYRVSTNSLKEVDENELIKFKFDLKQSRSILKSRNLKGKTIRIRKYHSTRFSDLVIAYYESDFERITQKRFTQHTNQGYKIMFMIDGQIMDDSFTLDDLDFNSLTKVAILHVLNSHDKIIFMISTNGKQDKKENS